MYALKQSRVDISFSYHYKKSRSLKPALTQRLYPTQPITQPVSSNRAPTVLTRIESLVPVISITFYRMSDTPQPTESLLFAAKFEEPKLPVLPAVNRSVHCCSYQKTVTNANSTTPTSTRGQIVARINQETETFIVDAIVTIRIRSLSYTTVSREKSRVTLCH